MNTAILIMAHDQPLHLAKLVEFLYCDWIRIFIHIDQKANLSDFNNCLERNNKIIFLDDKYRVNVAWGGFNQVKAMLNLLEVSLNFGEGYDRFCFLSGSDYPIKSLNIIKNEFDSKKEFMRIDRPLLELENNTHYKNVGYYYFMDNPFLKATIQRLKIKRRLYNNIPLYHGCQWWALTRDCVIYIRDYINNNKDYVAFHKHSCCSDEIFFHSIVKNSPYAKNLTHDYEANENLDSYFTLNEHGCHYIDWNAKGVVLPKVLNESDMEQLVKSKALFARKIRLENSGNLISMINNAISNQIDIC